MLLRLLVLGSFLIAAGMSGCSRSPATPPAKPVPAATVAHPRPETDLTTVTLSAEAMARVGIHTAVAASERLAATRTLAGEVIVPEGKTVVVSAPVAGTLTASGDARAGSRVEQGAAMFRLLPLASADREQRIEAERLVATAQAEHEAAVQRLQRLERLLKDGAASQRAVDDARAQQATAAAGLTAARERLSAITRNPIGAQGEIAINAPFAGVLQSISAAVGQTVAASAPLFTIAQYDTVWIRVPLYAGDVSTVDSEQSASVTSLGGASPSRQARRVVAPPRADPSAASVDLFYELPAGAPALRPGERVSVQLPLLSSESGLAIPDSAIVYDIHGGTWVYQDLGENVFSRRRVEIARHVGTKAVVARGIQAGARVVDVGAAELYGTEFGTGK